MEMIEVNIFKYVRWKYICIINFFRDLLGKRRNLRFYGIFIFCILWNFFFDIKMLDKVMGFCFDILDLFECFRS